MDLVELVKKVVNFTTSRGFRCFQCARVNLATVEATRAISNENLGANVESSAFGKHHVVVERCHRILLMIVDEPPTWRGSCRCLTAKLSEVYPEEIVCRQGLVEVRTRCARNTKI